MNVSRCYCYECRRPVSDASAHEWHRHDGAQTCWPITAAALAILASNYRPASRT